MSSNPYSNITVEGELLAFTVPFKVAETPEIVVAASVVTVGGIAKVVNSISPPETEPPGP